MTENENKENFYSSVNKIPEEVLKENISANPDVLLNPKVIQEILEAKKQPLETCISDDEVDW